MDPEIEDAEPIQRALAGSGWRRAHDMQPRRTRIVDLAADEDALWSELRKKWRQYVNKARSNGIVVRDVDPATETNAFDTFHDVMREVSQRTALPLRSAAALPPGLGGLRADRREPPPVRRGRGRRRRRPCCSSSAAGPRSSSRTAA